MARGFLSGIIWGGVLSVGVAAVASLSAVTAPMPQRGDAPAASDAPRESAAAQAQPTRDADLATEPGTSVPAPDTETAAVDPAVTATPQRPRTGEASGLETPADPGTGAGVEAATAGSGTGADAPSRPAPPIAESEPSISTDPAQPPAPEPAAEGAFETPDPEPEAASEARTEAALQPQPEVRQPTLPDTTSQADPLPSPSIGTPGVSLVDRDDAPAAPSGSSAAQPPIDAFAAAFPDPEERPLMSIVLIDDGTAPASGPIGVAALQSFPYPLSFAVDASLPDAAERAASYREQGIEVLALVDLPQGATAADVEVSIAAALDAVPEAVGVLEGTGDGLQSSREVSDQVTAILRDSGHGLLLQSKGLNTAQKLAVREGVPAAALFRDFDSAGQTPTVIRRFLDQAAFRASQEAGVVMLGRVRADTISALLLWGLQDRASRVALVPVSAVMKAQVTGPG